jgi:hypothetical protein
MRPANLDPNDPQVRIAVFGEQVQEFLHSPIGDYLIKQAERELQDAIDQLKAVDPTQVQSVTLLQIQIQQLEKFESWLGAAVQDGLNAIRAIDNEEEIDG